jgi:putative membrane protein
MIAAWNSVIAGLPVLIVHLAVTTGIFIVGIAVYLWVTPYHEVRLVRQGNVAAAVTASGAMLALVVPLAATMANSVSVPDIALWGAVAVVLQLIAFGAVALLFRELRLAIERGDIAPALVLAATQLSTGILNAAAMTG